MSFEMFAGAAKRAAAAVTIAAMSASSAFAGTPLVHGAQMTAGGGGAKVWFGGGAETAPIVLAQRGDGERRRGDGEGRRGGNRGDGEGRRARNRDGDRLSRAERRERREARREARRDRREGRRERRRDRREARYYGTPYCTGSTEDIDRCRNEARGIRSGDSGYLRRQDYGYGHGYGYYEDPYYHYEKKRRKRERRDLALGLIGSIVGLGAAAALSNRGGYAAPRRSYSGGGGSCDYWASQCAKNWGRNNSNFYGCLRYHRCN